MIERVMYGLPKDATERYEEVILLTNIQSDEQIEKVKELAGKDGFHSFRVADINLGIAPNFAKTLNRSEVDDEGEHFIGTEERRIKP